MKIEDVKLWIDTFGIQEVMVLEKILDDRRGRLVELMQEATPNDLIKKFDLNFLGITVFGTCDFAVLRDIGTLNISDIERDQYYKQAREEIKPLFKIWSQFGMILEKIDTDSCRGNAYEPHIRAYFKLQWK